MSNYPSSPTPAFQTEVDDVISALDNIEVVLDHNDRVPGVNETLEHLKQFANVLEMQAGGWLVEDVEGATRGALPQLGGQLDPLCFTTRESGGRLAKPEVSQSHVVESLEDPDDLGLILEELEGFLDGHLENIGDVVAFPENLKCLPVVPLASAHLTRHIHVGKEVHLDLDRAVAFARLTASSGHVEREATGFVAPGSRLFCLGEQGADVVEELCVGGRIGSRCSPDRRLVDVDHLVDQIDALDLLVSSRHHAGLVDPMRQCLPQDLLDESGLARPGHPGHNCEQAQGKLDVDALQVVRRGTKHSDGIFTAGTADQRDFDLTASSEIVTRDRVGFSCDVLEDTLGNYRAAMITGAGADVDDVVGGPDGLFVVLHHDQCYPGHEDEAESR